MACISDALALAVSSSIGSRVSAGAAASISRAAAANCDLSSGNRAIFVARPGLFMTQTITPRTLVNTTASHIVSTAVILRRTGAAQQRDSLGIARFIWPPLVDF